MAENHIRIIPAAPGTSWDHMTLDDSLRNWPLTFLRNAPVEPPKPGAPPAMFRYEPDDPLPEA
ncbi:hypothetical protein [Azospirillum sp. sgz301742]